MNFFGMVLANFRKLIAIPASAAVAKNNYFSTLCTGSYCLHISILRGERLCKDTVCKVNSIYWHNKREYYGVEKICDIVKNDYGIFYLCSLEVV